MERPLVPPIITSLALGGGLLDFSLLLGAFFLSWALGQEGQIGGLLGVSRGFGH